MTLEASLAIGDRGVYGQVTQLYLKSAVQLICPLNTWTCEEFPIVAQLQSNMKDMPCKSHAR